MFLYDYYYFFADGLQQAGLCLQVREEAVCLAISPGGTDSSHVRRTIVLSTRAYTNYIERTWINRTINVDCIPHGCEDKQRRRGMAPPHQQSCLPFYVLVILLHKETTSIPTQLKMISEGKLRRYQRKTTRLLQCRINQLWDRCNDGTIPAWINF